MTTTGLLTLSYGTPTLIGYVVQAHNIATKAGVNHEVADENGVVVARIRNDITSEISIEAVITTGTIPTPGASLTYNGVTYEVVSTDKKSGNKVTTTVSIKAIKSAGV